MIAPLEKLPQLLTTELSLIWAAHHAAGLRGYMCLYAQETQIPFRSKTPGVKLWFGPDETASVIQQIIHHYNQGVLPNTPLLLNPIVHTRNTNGEYQPLGSGIIWGTSLCLGVDVLKDDSAERLWQLGVHTSPFHRGENVRSGLKILALSDAALPMLEDRKSIAGCKELYEIANIQSDAYAHTYLLSGLSYLTNNGSFQHPDIASLFPKETLLSDASIEKTVQEGRISVGKILDAAYCWNAYERHHSLYEKFGINPDDVPGNLNFFNLVARDVQLFDATGPMRKEADEMFEFLVPGLIPRGSVTIMAGTGGSGKSTLVHQLCAMAATQYEPGEEAPRWLGQRLAIEKCQGICVYFAGEDSPAIINARAALFDPQSRASRLLFQRMDFGENISFTQHLKRLQKIPHIPMMVIDPARKYLAGDEEDSEAVSEFFDALEDFAVKKNTAIVVTHHLQKSANPKVTTEILDLLRGSQVFVDRARVIIGLFRDGPYTIAGLAKNNIPPNLGMISEERVFARDPKRLQLIWLPGHQGVRNANLSPEELELIEQSAHEEGRS